MKWEFVLATASEPENTGAIWAFAMGLDIAR